MDQGGANIKLNKSQQIQLSLFSYLLPGENVSFVYIHFTKMAYDLMSLAGSSLLFRFNEDTRRTGYSDQV